MSSKQYILGTLLLSIFAMSLGGTSSVYGEEYLPYRGKVIQVLDGTTIRLDSGRRIQLKALKVPTGKETEAREKLNEIVFQKEVTLQYEPKQPDRFGRTYAYVYLASNQNMVNRLMVDAGVAEISEDVSDSYYGKKLMGINNKDSDSVDDYEREFREDRKELSKKMNYQFWLAWGSIIAAIIVGLSIRAWMNHTSL